MIPSLYRGSYPIIALNSLNMISYGAFCSMVVVPLPISWRIIPRIVAGDPSHDYRRATVIGLVKGVIWCFPHSPCGVLDTLVLHPSLGNGETEHISKYRSDLQI